MQDVGQQARLGEELAAALGFGLALLGEADVDPSGEEVELVPVALAVAEEDQRIGRGHAAMIPTRRMLAHRPGIIGSWRPARSPVGQVTRGTTGTNRLRRVDRWIARHPALRRAADPLVVDLGYGASAVTALELAGTPGPRAADVEVLGLEIEPARVARAREQLAVVRAGATGFAADARVDVRARRLRGARRRTGAGPP